MLLTNEEIELAILPVIKNYAEANGLLGKRFLSNDITYDEYIKISGQLAREYELQYNQAIARAQIKKLYNDYECKECSTPGFVHLVLPRQSLLEEVK